MPRKKPSLGPGLPQLGPLPGLSRSSLPIEEAVDQFLTRVEQSAPAGLREVLFGSEQGSLGKAILADVVDVIPVAGDAANFFRVRDAARRGQGKTSKVTLQSFDLVVGAVPFIGDFLDLFTPTNTITYLRGRK